MAVAGAALVLASWLTAVSAQDLDVAAALEDTTCEESSSWLQRRASQRNSVSELQRDNVSDEEGDGGKVGFCESHTGGTCRFFDCASSRGPTQCLQAECRCQPGYCANGGSCVKNDGNNFLECPQRTGGTCSYFSKCWESRGPTRCVNGECLCQPGYCSDDDGKCHKMMGSFYAEVAPLSSHYHRWPGWQNDLQTALCISGGGTRAMVGAIGALRALEQLGLMTSFDLMVSVSGGTWAAAPYMFSHQETAAMLGAGTQPRDLSMAKLSQVPGSIGNSATEDIVELLKKGFENDNSHDVWVKVFNKILLEPHHLDDMSKYMASDEESLQRILQHNPQLSRSDFIVPVSKRPRAFVMLGVLLAPIGHKASDDHVVSLQMSPDFTGSPYHPGESGKVNYASEGTSWVHRNWAGTAAIPEIKDRLLGGGLVETFAFGGDPPYGGRGQGGGKHVRMPAPSEPFGLAKAVGVSSAAFAAYFAADVGGLLSNYIQKYLPVGTLWPITSKRDAGSKTGMKYKLGDGGNMDNSGLLPALQRKVPKIVMFVNTDIPISLKRDFCTARKWSVSEMEGSATWYFLDKFGIGAHHTGSFALHNQVFHFRDLQPLLCQFQKNKRHGRPSFAEATLEVLKNSWWGIEGGWQTNLLIFYLDRSRLFEQQLPADTQHNLRLGIKGPFAHFPNFALARQNPDKLIAFTKPQVNLLSSYVEWAVKENSGLFYRHLQRSGGRVLQETAQGGVEALNPNFREGSSSSGIAPWEAAR